MEIIFNKDSASLKFWTCGCCTFFLSTQPTFSGQDLISYFYLPRDLIPWTEPLLAAANNASPGWPPPIVKSIILYRCPESHHCQAVGGLGGLDPPPPGSRIISSVSPNLTLLVVTPFRWAGKSWPAESHGDCTVWEQMRTTRTVTAVTVDIIPHVLCTRVVPSILHLLFLWPVFMEASGSGSFCYIPWKQGASDV